MLLVPPCVQHSAAASRAPQFCRRREQHHGIKAIAVVSRPPSHDPPGASARPSGAQARPSMAEGMRRMTLTVYAIAYSESMSQTLSTSAK
jgi:hypothetical protein